MNGGLLTSEDREAVFRLAERITGTCQTGKYRRPLLLSNVERRIRLLRFACLAEYLDFALNDPSEYSHLVSSLTIHTTRWFRESPHFEALENILLSRAALDRGCFRVLCAACSTGEEAYSLAMVFESYRRLNPSAEYQISAFDIDPVSITTARASVYERDCMKQIPGRYHHLMWRGSGRTADLCVPAPELRSRVTFAVGSILDEIPFSKQVQYDLLVCRNVLIYLDPPDCTRALSGLLKYLAPEGRIFLGHSDVVDTETLGIEALGQSVYQPVGESSSRRSPSLQRPVRQVLVIDDCPVTRKLLRHLLEEQSFLVETTASAEEASVLVAQKKFDVITLDVQMSGVDGTTWLRRIRREGIETPVVIVSGMEDFEAGSVVTALEAGAQDVLAKSQLNSRELGGKLNALLEEPVVSLDTSVGTSYSLDHFRPDVILAGASTGGIEALCSLFADMPRECPPVVIVQHIPGSFAASVAQRICQVSGLALGSMQSGAVLRPGHLYAALGDYHISLARARGELILKLSSEPPYRGHRPCVEYLFQSAAALPSVRSYAVLLTGMGDDGAQGLLSLHQKGDMTFAQDAATSVVYGMPAEAVRLGAARYIGSPGAIRRELQKAMPLPLS